jgi:pimeloyl-ACP methyl ester carboxylesterase
LLHHGIAGSSINFVMQQAGSIPYQLADTGLYDVWLTNARGSQYSRAHQWLDPDSDPEFWDFSFIEFGQYDLPAVVEKIKQERPGLMSVIGHS